MRSEISTGDGCEHEDPVNAAGYDEASHSLLRDWLEHLAKGHLGLEEDADDHAQHQPEGQLYVLVHQRLVGFGGCFGLGRGSDCDC